MKEPVVNLDLALEHGLTEDEFVRINNILGRTPTFTELGIFSVMWSEHCSYKNSIALLKTLPRSGGRLLVGAGEENAGLVDIGDDLAVAFKIESHNHPSAVEPYQGAATGVGGIMRDIFTMGARPIASLNSLRFGSLNDARTRFLFEGVVKGIGDYGNSFGVPTVAGERGGGLVHLLRVTKDEIFRPRPDHAPGHGRIVEVRRGHVDHHEPVGIRILEIFGHPEGKAEFDALFDRFGVWFVVEMTVVFPYFRPQGFRHLRYEELGHTPGAIAESALTRPWRISSF